MEYGRGGSDKSVSSEETIDKGRRIMACSERALYKDISEEIKLNNPCEAYIWGEDLYDLMMIVYSGNINSISEYTLIKQDVLDCGLFFYNRKQDCLRMEKVRIHEPSGDLYISEKIFNAIWPSLRESIKIGIELAPEDAENVAQTPEDVVYLQLADRKNQNPVLTSKGIEYEVIQPSEEEKKLRSRRQSMMDNRDMIFCYSKQGGYVHDKYCPDIKEISDEDFMASTEYPKGVSRCPHCRLMMVLREACKPQTKQIPALFALFRRRSVGYKQLKRLILEKGFKFYLNSPDELAVVTREDRWLVRFLNGKKLSLWHNNYIKISDTERSITEGYHKQGDFWKSLKVVLGYIDRYSWEKIHVENASALAEVPESEENVKSRSDYSGFGKWFVTLWKRFIALFQMC